MAVSTLVVGSALPVITFAQTNDQIVAQELASPSWWYASTDKSLVTIISKTDKTATLQAPVAKKDGQVIDSYYITWAPMSFQEMTSDATTTDDLQKIKSSDDVALATGGTPMYKVEGDKIIFTIDIAEPNKDIYVTILPEDENRVTGNGIEDFSFNLSTVQVGSTGTTTTVAGDVYDPALNQAITNVTCVWDATANRTTLLWDINTAISASRVEISHRPDEKQGDMTVKGTPNITDRRFVVDTPHRDVQLFRLKPLDGAGTMVGNEIQYICKPAPVSETPVTPTNPSNPISVTPATGPKETAVIVLLISVLGYALYRKVRKA